MKFVIDANIVFSGILNVARPLPMTKLGNQIIIRGFPPTRE